jgi:hypothetical protein
MLGFFEFGMKFRVPEQLLLAPQAGLRPLKLVSGTLGLQHIIYFFYIFLLIRSTYHLSRLIEMKIKNLTYIDRILIILVDISLFVSNVENSNKNESYSCVILYIA